jgi:hypothetical protein
MTKRSGVVIFMVACLAGFMGQVAAFGADTNSVWNLDVISLFSIGKDKFVETNAASAVFLSDGTATLLIGTNEFSGDYTNTTKQITLSVGSEGLAGLESNALDFVNTELGADTNIVTATVSGIKFASKIKLSKTGVPVAAADKVKGTLTATVRGKHKTKAFSIATVYVDWTLESGADF